MTTQAKFLDRIEFVLKHHGPTNELIFRHLARRASLSAENVIEACKERFACDAYTQAADSYGIPRRYAYYWRLAKTQPLSVEQAIATAHNMWQRSEQRRLEPEDA